MCDFCEKYGANGGRWYFNPANYARRLYKVRRTASESSGFGEVGELGGSGMGMPPPEASAAAHEGDILKVAEIARKFDEHYDPIYHQQVITPDEAKAIMDIAYPIAVEKCACRLIGLNLPNNPDHFTCMGLGPGMYKWQRWPQACAGGISFLKPEEAKDFLDRTTRRGLVHMIATFGAPYIGGMCQCEYAYCGGIRKRRDYGIRSGAWKGHYIGKVDPKTCNGCRQCISYCQFGALHYSPGDEKAHLDMFKCFGCGLCAEVCKPRAISLVERTSIPALANDW